MVAGKGRKQSLNFVKIVDELRESNLKPSCTFQPVIQEISASQSEALNDFESSENNLFVFGRGQKLFLLGNIVVNSIPLPEGLSYVNNMS